nr:PREDICTED: mitochondrial assembly of ribosomal large subunit protein 1 [Balearica regulorum gibbericeps]
MSRRPPTRRPWALPCALPLCEMVPYAKYTILPKFNIDFVVALLRQENAKDICVIQLPPEIKYCNYFIIVSGSSTRHLHAMAHYMLKMEKGPLQLGSIVMHFMLPETREVYELEKLWTLGSYDDQLAQITPQSLPEDFIFGLTPNSTNITPLCEATFSSQNHTQYPVSKSTVTKGVPRKEHREREQLLCEHTRTLTAGKG